MNILSFSFTLSCITIFLAIQSLLYQAFSQTEDSEIEETCKKYSVIPDNGIQRCVAILNAIRDHKHEDPKTMALMGMEFAALKVQQTIENIKKILKNNKSLKPRYYRALRTCIKRYDDGSFSFGFGILDFKQENYGNIDYGWLKTAFDDVFQCERELNKVGAKGEDFGIKTEFNLEVSDSAKAAFDYFINKHLNNFNNVNKLINGNIQDVMNNNFDGF